MLPLPTPLVGLQRKPCLSALSFENRHIPTSMHFSRKTHYREISQRHDAQLIARRPTWIYTYREPDSDRLCCYGNEQMIISKACVRFIYLIVLLRHFLAGPTLKSLAPLDREAESWVMLYAFKQFISSKLLTVGRTSRFRNVGRFQSYPRKISRFVVWNCLTL